MSTLIWKIAGVYNWFKGKKRRIGNVSFALAGILPEPASQVAFTIGILFGGSDLMELGAQKYKQKKTKRK